MGWNNTGFRQTDAQHNFFKANRYPYITHSSPNSEHDGLHIARAAQLLNPKTLKTGLTEKGNPSFALESLATCKDLTLLNNILDVMMPTKVVKFLEFKKQT